MRSKFGATIGIQTNSHNSSNDPKISRLKLTSFANILKVELGMQLIEIPQKNKCKKCHPARPKSKQTK